MAKLTEKEIIAIVKEVAGAYDYGYPTSRGNSTIYTFFSNKDMFELVDRSTKDKTDVQILNGGGLSEQQKKEIIEKMTQSQSESLIFYDEKFIRNKVEQIMQDTFSKNYLEKNREVVENMVQSIVWKLMKMADEKTGKVSKKRFDDNIKNIHFEPIFKVSTHFSYSFDIANPKGFDFNYKIREWGCYWVRMPRYYHDQASGGEQRPALVIGRHPESDCYYVALLEHKQKPIAEDFPYLIGKDNDGKDMYLSRRPFIPVHKSDFISFECRFDKERSSQTVELLKNDNRFSTAPDSVLVSFLGNSKHDELAKRLAEYEKNYQDPTEEELKIIVGSVLFELEREEPRLWSFAKKKDGEYAIEVNKKDGETEIECLNKRGRNSLPLIVRIPKGQKSKVYSNTSAFRKADYAKINKVAFDVAFTKGFLRYLCEKPGNEMFKYAVSREVVETSARSYAEDPNPTLLHGCIRAIAGTFASVNLHYNAKKLDDLVIKGLSAMDLSKFGPLNENQTEDDGSEIDI